MNNKGFTLVELLATLLVLAIVVSVGTVSIIAIVNGAKEKNYDLLISNIKSAAELYYQECRYSNTATWCNTSGDYQVTLGELVTYGYLKGNKKNDNHTYTIVNPKDEKEIATCTIRVYYAVDKVKVEALSGGNSCPTQADYGA